MEIKLPAFRGALIVHIFVDNLGIARVRRGMPDNLQLIVNSLFLRPAASAVESGRRMWEKFPGSPRKISDGAGELRRFSKPLRVSSVRNAASATGTPVSILFPTRFQDSEAKVF